MSGAPGSPREAWPGCARNPALEEVRQVADAVLYEGYILYPYRASAQKNRSRWQFGVLMPPGYTAVEPSETSVLRAECVFEPSAARYRGQPTVDVTVRFLQVQRRRTEQGADDSGAPPVWDEAVEHEVTVLVPSQALLGDGDSDSDTRRATVTQFTIPGGAETETTAGARVTRRREPLTGTVSVRATPLPGPWRARRLTVEVANESEYQLPSRDSAPADSVGAPGSPPGGSRDAALPAALIAAHLIITVDGGAFLSMTDPPEWARPQVEACQNTGCWPVLAGPEGSRQVILAAPIILPEYPQVAKESPGELYDGTEIDEILTLRTLALSEEEKAAARATDPRAAALIDRVDAIDAPTMAQLHGTIRAGCAPDGQDRHRIGRATGRYPPGGRPPVPPATASRQPADHANETVPWWDPGADASVSPGTDSVVIAGCRVARGSRVVLRPGRRRADAQDMFLAGRTARVEAVLLDVDDTAYLAVTLADDEAADLQAAHGRFLYFAPDEVEPE